MSSILLEAEKSRYLPTFEPDPEAQTFSRVGMSLSGAAHRISQEIGGEAILITSHTAEPALLLSKRRGRAPMICICTDARLWQAYCMYWGIAAVLVEQATDLQALLESGIDSAIAHGFVRDGQQAVILSHFDERHVAGLKLQKI